MNFLALQDLVLTWLDDLNAGYFTRPQIKVWINNGQREAAKLLLLANQNWYVKCAETDTVIGQECYFVPEDFLKVRRLEIVKNEGTSAEIRKILEPITMNQQDIVPFSRGEPWVYDLVKDKFFVYPTPDQVYTLRLHYCYRVVDMTQDAEEPDLPEEYHEFPAVLATIDGLLKDRRDITALVEKRNYYQEMMKRDAQQRRIDRPRRVISSSYDGWTFE